MTLINKKVGQEFIMMNIGLIYNLRYLFNLGRLFGPLNQQIGSTMFGNNFSGRSVKDVMGLKRFERHTANRAVNLRPEEQKMINMVNAERMAHGLSSLVVDMDLVDTARFKSRDMLHQRYFDHYSPVYGSPQDLVDRMGISYKLIGENLARVPTAERAHLGLMNSTGHRGNILNRNFKRIGVGVVNGGADGKIFTQHFAG